MSMKVSGQVPSSGDVDAIAKLVAAVDDAQRREDADAFLALFCDTAVWVTGHGKRLYGLPTIAEFTRRVLPGATAEAYATYTPDHVLFVRSDIAVVNVTQKYIPRDSAKSDLLGQVGSPVLILAKEAGAWRIAAAQNTAVVADA